MTQQPMTLAIEDPGPGSRLGPGPRRELRDKLRAARRNREAALLLRVSGDAWDQSPVMDGESISAEGVSKELHSTVVDLFSLEMPVVVLLQGRISGLGLALALACDIRLGASTATLGVGDPQTPNALLSGATWLLTHRVGSAVATDLAWTGCHLDRDEAVRLGLLSRESGDEEVAARIAGQLAAVSTGASSALKRALNGRLVADFAAQLDYDSWLAVVSARSSS